MVKVLQEQRGFNCLAGVGPASRLEWACAILACEPHPEEQVAKSVGPTLRQDFHPAAEHPAHSVLDCARVEEGFGVTRPPCLDAMYLAMGERER